MKQQRDLSIMRLPQVGQLGEQLNVLRASYRQLAGIPEAPTKVILCHMLPERQ